MKEEIKEKRPVSSKWLLFTVLGIVFIILAIKQYKPGTWGYYFAHIYFLIGGILIITFSGAFILEQAKKEPFYFRYALKINQLDSKYQSNILIILMLFVIHFFALSYIGTQIVEILPLDKTNSNYPYDIIWMARQNDEKYSEKIAEKYNGTVKHIPMIRATMFYSQEEIGISESTYKELTGKAYGLSGKEIVIGIEDQNYQREEKVTDKVLYDLFGWLYIGKFNPNKKEFESSNILKDANYQYRIKEIHTQNVFGKFVPEDAGEGCEDTVIFSDEYFDKQWKKQAADDEEVSMLEVFSFPKTKEQMAWKEIKDHADKEGITVFQPDDSHSPHAICYDKTVFLKEQKASNIFLLFKTKISDRCYSWCEEEGRVFIRCERNIQRHVVVPFTCDRYKWNVLRRIYKILLLRNNGNCFDTKGSCNVRMDFMHIWNYFYDIYYFFNQAFMERNFKNMG